MTGADVIASAAVPLGFGLAAVAIRPAVKATGLGIVHPAVVWLALEAVFFGFGSIALAAGEDRVGPALFIAGAAAAAGLGTLVAHRAWQPRSAAFPAGGPTSPLPETGWRRFVPAALAIIALLILAPTLGGSGLALLSADPTAARAELVGIPVQLIRVALPGLAAVILLQTLGGRPASRHRVASWVVIGILVVLSILLASRYLVIELGATLVLVWLLTGRRIAPRLALAAGVVAVAGFVAIGVARAPNDFANGPVVTAAERTVSRLFLVQPRTIAALQDAIPSEQPYFLGLTWIRRLGPYLGRPDIPNLGYWIYPRVVATEQTTAGYAAPGLLGEAWANFGPAGLGLFALLGVAMERAGVLIASRRTRVVDIAAGALLILFVARTHALGLLGVALLLGLVLGWRSLAGSWSVPAAGSRDERAGIGPDGAS